MADLVVIRGVVLAVCAAELVLFASLGREGTAGLKQSEDRRPSWMLRRLICGPLGAAMVYSFWWEPGMHWGWHVACGLMLVIMAVQIVYSWTGSGWQVRNRAETLFGLAVCWAIVFTLALTITRFVAGEPYTFAYGLATLALLLFFVIWAMLDFDKAYVDAEDLGTVMIGYLLVIVLISSLIVYAGTAGVLALMAG